MSKSNESPPVLKMPTRVEWDNEIVDVFVDDDEEAMLMTAQDGASLEAAGYYSRKTEDLFSCLQKLVIASMSVGLIGLGVAFIFLIEYIAGW